MIAVLRFVITLVVLGISVNHGVDAGKEHNPGWGVVWGIIFFLFWLFVCQGALTLLVTVGSRFNSFMDDHTY